MSAPSLSDVSPYRLALFACLDQLHEAQQTIQRQREHIAEMREGRDVYRDMTALVVVQMGVLAQIHEDAERLARSLFREA